MDFDGSPSTSLGKCCDCGCSCNYSMNRSLSGTWFRSVKRKFDENCNKDSTFFENTNSDLPQVARVEVSNERDALREMVTNQQETIQDLSLELEEERNASSSATNEAMSMILRLQREKAEIQMESRQFKRFAEEKMAHDQEELSAMEDLLYKREEAMQELYCEVEAYKNKLMSYGVYEGEEERENGFDYPSLKCNLNENQENLDGEDGAYDDTDKYVFVETTKSHDNLKDLEFRINQLEKGPDLSPKNIPEKVILDHSPLSRHTRSVSNENANSFSANSREMGPDSPTESPKFGASFREKENTETNYPNLRNIDTNIDAVSEAEDDTIDRVYTIDSMHQGVSYKGEESKAKIGVCDDNLGDTDIKKLYLRLQALEADRESMRQALVSMRTDKAQLVLLKEIAQHLCKEMTPAKKMPVKKPSGSFSFIAVLKWIWSFIFWRKKARQSKYMFGASIQNPGLLMLLDKGPRIGQWRCLSRAQM